MKILVLMFALLLPIIGFAAWEPEYHANIITITYLDEIVLSLVFFIINLGSSIYYDILGPITTYLLVYFVVFMYYFYKNLMTGRIGELFLTLYKSPTNNFVTKTIFYFILLYTFLIPVQVDMYKLGGDKVNGGLSEKVQLSTTPNNRIQNPKETTINERYYSGILETLSNVKIAEQVEMSSSSNIHDYVSNKAPLIFAYPINLMQRIIYGVPFMEEVQPNQTINQSWSFMSVMGYTFPGMNKIYKKTIENPSELVNVYVDYFSKVNDTAGAKAQLLSVKTKYIKDIENSFPTNKQVWQDESLFTYALPPVKIENTKEGKKKENESPGEKENKEAQENVMIVSEKFNKYIASLDEDISKNAMSTPLIKKLVIVEFLSYFGFEKVLNSATFYEKINNIITETAGDHTGKDAVFPVEEDQSRYQDKDYESLILKVQSIIEGSESVGVSKIKKINSNDAKYLNKQLRKVYMEKIFKKYTDEEASINSRVEVPVVEHPLSVELDSIKLNDDQKDAIKALSLNFTNYRDNMKNWITAENNDIKNIGASIEREFLVLVDVFFMDNNPIRRPKDNIKINELLEAKTNLFNEIQKYNEIRKKQYIDEMMEEKMFKKFLENEINTSYIQNFIKSYLITQEKTNISNPKSAFPLESEPKTVSGQIRGQDRDIELELYNNYNAQVNGIYLANQSGASGEIKEGFYVLGRKTSPIILKYDAKTLRLDNSYVEGYEDYMYFSIFNQVLSELYNQIDSVFKIKYTSSILDKSNSNLNINGLSKLIDEQSRIDTIISVLSGEKHTRIGENGEVEYDAYKNKTPKLVILDSISDNGSATNTILSTAMDLIPFVGETVDIEDKGRDFYQEVVFNQSAQMPTLQKIASEYNKEIRQSKEERDEPLSTTSTSNRTFDKTDKFYSTKAFKYKMYNNEMIDLVMNNKYQEDIFNNVYTDVKSILKMYKGFADYFNEDEDGFENSTGIDNIEEMTARSVIQKYLMNYSWESDFDSSGDDAGYFISNVVMKIMKTMYYLPISGLYTKEHGDTDITGWEIAKIAGVLSAWFGAEAVEGVDKFTGGNLSKSGWGLIVKVAAKSIKLIIIIAFLNAFILSIFSIYIAIMMMLFFKEYVIGVAKSMYKLVNSMFKTLIDISKGNSIPESLDNLFFATIEVMLMQLPLVVIMLASIFFAGIIRYIMLEFYLGEIFLKDFGFFDNFVLIIVVGILTIIYLKAIYHVIKKITKHEGFTNAKLAESFWTKASAQGKKALRGGYDQAKSASSDIEEKYKSTERYKNKKAEKDVKREIEREIEREKQKDRKENVRKILSKINQEKD